MQTNSKKDFFHVSGDKHQEVSSGINLNQSALCHPVVWYPRMGEFLTLDAFAMPGTPLYLVVRCPFCQSRNPDSEGMDLTIKADQKGISLDHKAMPKFPGFETSEVARGLGLQSADDLRGVLSVDEFGCTWEEEPELKRDFGFSCCQWNVVIENNVARDVPRRK
jgi:hypothetical protein